MLHQLAGLPRARTDHRLPCQMQANSLVTCSCFARHVPSCTQLDHVLSTDHSGGNGTASVVSSVTQVVL